VCTAYDSLKSCRFVAAVPLLETTALPLSCEPCAPSWRVWVVVLTAWCAWSTVSPCRRVRGSQAASAKSGGCDHGQQVAWPPSHWL
jgi:hypothetical protein